MTKLASLKQTFKEWSEPQASADRDEYYPNFYLDERSLDAMKLDNVKAGTELTMISTVRVSSVSDNKNGSRSMSFELIEAAMEPKQKDPEPASILFPNG